MVDSIVQSAVFNSLWGYMKNYHSLPWNLPEKKNFYNKLHFRIICYLGKCIPVSRGVSSNEGKKLMHKMLYVLSKGDVLSIFPEGKRSRSGKVDDQDFSYGIGQILNECDGARVICLYMRGKNHGGFANYPTKGEDFYLKMEMIRPSSSLKGLRKVRDYSTQVIKKLVAMEEEFFGRENLHWQ